MSIFEGSSRFAPPSSSVSKIGMGILVILLLVGGFVGLQVWWWMFCRIEIEPGKVGVLIAKLGRNLPPGEIIATSTEYKGIQLGVLSEGRHFYNPILWDWEFFPVTEVPVGQVGILMCQYGRDFTEAEIKAGKVIAEPGQKGVQKDVLQPGKYRLNPYAERLQLQKALDIPAGYVGVVTNLAGKIPRQANAFLVDDGEKGISRKVLTPGTHYLNPYMFDVVLMDCRSQKLELSGDEALVFPSSDAFEMTVHLTVEWAIDPASAPLVFARIGEMDRNPNKNELLQKVVVPAIRGFGRIEGSKYPAIDYIAGKSREVFQNSLQVKMQKACESKGIIIKSILINDITPPQEIATPIREREIAKEELNRNLNQLKQAQAEQDLARSEELIKQETEKVTANTQNLVKIISAENRRKIALIDQDKRLNMEATFLEASRKEAEAILARGKAQADVTLLESQAEADSFKKAIEAFKSPEIFAYYEFLNRVAPAINTIFANTDSPFGKIFHSLIPGADEKKGGN
jgi:regulator of protease activity HflC (stomatin/prohibitin superfamily)